MSVQLVVEMLDLPVKMTPAERLLLVALAERANPETRECWPGEAELCRRTDLSARGLQDAFTRLARRGIEVRVPSRRGGSGRGAYSHTGHQRTYRLPKVVTPEREQSGGEESAPDGVVTPERATGHAEACEVVTFRRDPNRHWNRQRTVNSPDAPQQAAPRRGRSAHAARQPTSSYLDEVERIADDEGADTYAMTLAYGMAERHAPLPAIRNAVAAAMRGPREERAGPTPEYLAVRPRARGAS